MPGVGAGPSHARHAPHSWDQNTTQHAEGVDGLGNDEATPVVHDSWSEGFLDGYLSGYLEGITRGRTLEAADMDKAWQPAYQAAQDTASATPDAQHWTAVKARQIASCEAQRQQAHPWPDEVTT